MWCWRCVVWVVVVVLAVCSLGSGGVVLAVCSLGSSDVVVVLAVCSLGSSDVVVVLAVIVVRSLKISSGCNRRRCRRKQQ